MNNRHLQAHNFEDDTSIGPPITTWCCFACVPHASVAIIEKWGKFSKLGHAGFNWAFGCLGDKIAGSVSLRVQQISITVETKTKDNVFVTLQVVVQYQVIESAIYDAFYRLSNPSEQIKSYVFDGKLYQYYELYLINSVL